MTYGIGSAIRTEGTLPHRPIQYTKSYFFSSSLHLFSLCDTVLNSNFPTFHRPRYKEIIVPQPCVFCTREFPDGAKTLDSTTYFYIIDDPMPVARGHLRIVPVTHRADFFDLTQREVTDFLGIREIAKARLEDMPGPAPKGYHTRATCVLGKGGPHACLHIIPIFQEEAFEPLPRCLRSVPSQR